MENNKYQYSESDRPDPKDIDLVRTYTPKKVALQQALSKVVPAKVNHMFSADTSGLPVQGVSSGTGIHLIWNCSVNGKNVPKEGLDVVELLQIAVTRLQYIQQSTELSYPVNDEVLIHLFNAIVLLQNSAKSKEELGLIDIHEAYS